MSLTPKGVLRSAKLRTCSARSLTRALCAASLLALLIATPLMARDRGTGSGGAAGAAVTSLSRLLRGPFVSGALGIAPPAAALPPICVVKPAYHSWRDRDCYVEMEALRAAETRNAPLCWGVSGNASQPLVFHTVSLSALPSALPLLVDSFLATQCCDAVLNVWVDARVLAAARAAGSLPPVQPNHAGRVLYRALDVDALFESVRGDFPDVNSTAAARMKDFADIRFRANWARILVLYIYGGVYVDLDTMFLRDFRTLLHALPGAFTYRQGR